ncbi:MAG: AMP-binding protein [Myxococcota bacterium]
MGPDSEIRTFVDLLRFRASTTPDAIAYRFLPHGDGPGLTWTYQDLWARSRGVASWLQEQGLQPGDRVAVVVDEGLSFHAALYGCMIAQVVAVPLHPPDPGRPDRTLRRVVVVGAKAGVRLVLTTAQHTDVLRQAWEGPRPDHFVDIEPIGPSDVAPVTAPEAASIAYLQYTSGSTSVPRGVRVSHDNLLHQLTNFDIGYAHDPDAVMVSWLPATHDLGLVYGRMMPIFKGIEGVFLDPADFVARPIRWLRAIHDHRGTHTPTPNFGLELAVARTTPTERQSLDLRSLRVIVNGAEPIRRSSEERFRETFAPYGLPGTALTHAYGMSESTAKITSEPIDRESARFLRVDRVAYEQGRIQVSSHEASAIEVASTGSTVGDTVVRIVDPQTKAPQGPGQVGEVWVSGRTVAQGYEGEPDATKATFEAYMADGTGPFLRTGDLGFLHEGELYLSGRLKDLVILRGENHHPEDLEWTAEHAHAAIRPHGTAAFAVPGPQGEALALVAEVTPEQSPPEVIIAALRKALAAHGVAAEALVLVAPRAVPKTSSGKIQRSRARDLYLSGALPTVHIALREATSQATSSSVLGQSLDGASPRRQTRLLTQHLRRLVGPLVGLAEADVPTDLPLRDLGLDSITGTELLEQVGRDLRVEVPGTALFDHPTIEALTRYLLEMRG